MNFSLLVCISDILKPSSYCVNCSTKQFSTSCLSLNIVPSLALYIFIVSINPFPTSKIILQTFLTSLSPCNSFHSSISFCAHSSFYYVTSFQSFSSLVISSLHFEYGIFDAVLYMLYFFICLYPLAFIIKPSLPWLQDYIPQDLICSLNRCSLTFPILHSQYHSAVWCTLGLDISYISWHLPLAFFILDVQIRNLAITK